MIAYLLETGSGVPAPFVPKVNLADHISNPISSGIVRLVTFGGSVSMWSPKALQQYALAIAGHGGNP